MVWYNEYVTPRPLLFWRGYWQRSTNLYSNKCSLPRHVISLCHYRIAAAKGSIVSCVDARWHSFTCRVFSQTALKSTVWWLSYLSSFPISVASKVFWTHTNRFLVMGICEIQSVSVSSANCIWYERCHQNCNSRDSYCHSTCCSAIHHLPHAKCQLCEGGYVKNLWNTIKFFILCCFSVLGCPHF